MKILDLFCGAGGCAAGYKRAADELGIPVEITGVDNRPMPRYPFLFVHADALEYCAKHGAEYDFIHASPPCQAHTSLKYAWSGDARYSTRHQDLIPKTRELLKATGRHYAIENVMLAPLEGNVVVLCGTYFDLKVYRHRQFETDLFLLQPPHSPHRDNTPSSGRGASRNGFVSVTGNGGATRAAYCGIGYTEYAAMAMGIDWMTREELSQAIPPAYTCWLGLQLFPRIMEQQR